MKRTNRKRINLVKVGITFGIFVVLIFGMDFLLEKPKVELIGEQNVNIKLGEEYKEYGVKAKLHNKDIDKQVEIKGTVDTGKIGKYTVKYCLKDKEYAERIVEVKDNVNPVIQLKGKKIINLQPNTEYKEQGYIATDNYDGNITDKIKIKEETINDQEYKIIYEIQDTSGNIAKDERIVIRNIEKGQPKENNSVIYLTFDDGPSMDITPKILDVLKEEDVKATFFILDYNNKKEELVKREAKEGHSIGLHGISHNYKEIYQSLEAGTNNFINLNKKVKESTGIDTKIIRFPGGSSNTVSKFNPGIMTNLAKNLLENEYKYFDWNVSSGDSGDVKTSEAVYSNVTKGLRKNRNNVVLMHDFAGNTKTLNALRKIIQYGKSQGYRFEKITETTPMVTQKIAN